MYRFSNTPVHCASLRRRTCVPLVLFSPEAVRREEGVLSQVWFLW